MVVAPLDTSTRTDPKASRLRSNSSHLGNVRFRGSIYWKGSDDLDLWNTEITGQLQGHFSRTLCKRSPKCAPTFHSSSTLLLRS